MYSLHTGQKFVCFEIAGDHCGIVSDVKFDDIFNTHLMYCC